MVMFLEKKESPYVLLDREIILNPLLSCEGKGIYGCLESGCMTLEEVPKNIIKELKLVGYLEVKI
jgi:hypothetical protein